MKPLLYRRQFLLTNIQFPFPLDWNYFKAGQYHLYAHPDLDINQFEDEKRDIIILGNIYDHSGPSKTNQDILHDIAFSTDSFNSVIHYIKKYSGRYALFYKDDEYEAFIPDALALREIYYCLVPNRVVCGSQPNLIAEFSDPKLDLSKEGPVIDFYNAHIKNGRWDPACQWIGDETCFEGIKHLLPNHYLDLARRTVIRFWPDSRPDTLSLDGAVAKASSFLQGSIKAMVERHPVMMGITSGMDSRTIFAASKELTDNIYYFINNYKLGHAHPDVAIPKEMFHALSIPFHIHDVPTPVDEEFKSIFLRNTFLATERILPTIFNIYYKHLQNKVNIIGIGEIGRTRYGKGPRKPKGYRLAYKHGYKKNIYAEEKAEEILRKMMPVYRKYAVNVMTGFYWEHSLGNWGAVGNSESDIAIEEVNPFNSYELYEIMLGVEDKYTKYRNNILFRRLIEYMWPELLDWPISPPYKLHDKIKSSLDSLGVFDLMQEIKYSILCSFYRFLYKPLSARKNTRRSSLFV